MSYLRQEVIQALNSLYTSDDTDITGIDNIAVSITRNTATGTANRRVNAGGRLKIVCTADNSATKISWIVKYTRV